MSPLRVSYRSMTSRFQPFAFVELVSPYNKKNITRWLEDMNFMFSWQEQYLTSERSERVRYCSCHENIKFISSSQRVISSMYFVKESCRQFLYFTVVSVRISVVSSGSLCRHKSVEVTVQCIVILKQNYLLAIELDAENL